MELFILAKNSLVAEELLKKQLQVLQNNLFRWDLKATGLKQEHRQGLMAGALIIQKWKNSLAILK